jgi:hypothetical protein
LQQSLNIYFKFILRKVTGTDSNWQEAHRIRLATVGLKGNAVFISAKRIRKPNFTTQNLTCREREGRIKPESQH